MKSIDLNADVGEGSPHDAELIPLVTSANIACGAHAGDAATIEAAARVAVEHGVAIGAHPGHPDPDNFGRRELPITPGELRALLQEQADRLHQVVVGLGGEVRYLKLHGALYHQTHRDPDLADAVIEFLDGYHTPLGLLGLGGSVLEGAAEASDIAFASEGFPDRAYDPNGRLKPRSEAGAVLTGSEAIASQAVALSSRCDSLCLHGDHPGAAAHAAAVRNALQAAGVRLARFTL